MFRWRFVGAKFDAHAFQPGENERVQVVGNNWLTSSELAVRSEGELIDVEAWVGALKKFNLPAVTKHSGLTQVWAPSSQGT